MPCGPDTRLTISAAQKRPRIEVIGTDAGSRHNYVWKIHDISEIDCAEYRAFLNPDLETLYYAEWLGTRTWSNRPQVGQSSERLMPG
jgi:hypothetical protein